jgi:hypothetical protein
MRQQALRELGVGGGGLGGSALGGGVGSASLNGGSAVAGGNHKLVIPGNIAGLAFAETGGSFGPGSGRYAGGGETDMGAMNGGNGGYGPGVGDSHGEITGRGSALEMTAVRVCAIRAAPMVGWPVAAPCLRLGALV